MVKDASDLRQGGILLADLIQTLRSELQRAQAQGSDQQIQFATDKVELELQVAVSQSGKGTGGVEFWVVKAGGELERSNVTTHAFKLTLVPVSGPRQDRAVVGGETKDAISGK